MKIAGVKLESFLWILYPIAVIGLIIFGINYWSTTGSAEFSRLTSKPEEANAEQKIVDNLREKLVVLKGFDKSTHTENIKKLLVAVPVSKKAWYVISELQLAGASSGAQLATFRSSVGDVSEASDSGAKKYDPNSDMLSFTAEYEGTTFGSLAEVLRILEGNMPFVKVTKIDYSGQIAKLWVDGAWRPWQEINKDVSTPLPKYLPEEKRALERLTEFDEVAPY